MSGQIVVIDDDPSILEAIRLTLEDEGYSVIVSDSPSVLSGDMGKLNPSLIILDVLLSGVDGREIARKLKSQKETKLIPIVMISAHPSAAQTVKSYGADDFISKPFNIDELLDKVSYYTS